jgi:hypothetical protein
MAHNPMIEIVLEKALNALSACDNVLAQELITLEYKEERFKNADQIKERVKQISDLKREVESVLRQGNSLDL